MLHSIDAFGIHANGLQLDADCLQLDRWIFFVIKNDLQPLLLKASHLKGTLKCYV